MSRWYRAYEGTVTDAKLHEAAMIAGVSRSVAISSWHALLESAAGRNNCGSFDTTARRIAVILCEPIESIEALFAAFNELGLVGEGAVKAWKRRQFQSDGSNERVKRYRENRKAQGLQAQWQPSKELRQSIYDRDGNACVYCQSEDDLTIDHRTPEMHGGDHSPENLQTACRPCNARKRDLTHEEYVARLSGNGAVTLQKRPHRQNTDSERSSPNGDSSADADTPLTKSEILEAWRTRMVPLGFPAVAKMTAQREKQLKARLKDSTLEEWQRAMDALERSAFCRGENDRGWWANFDFLLQPKSFTKLLEGAYDH